MPVSAALAPERIAQRLYHDLERLADLAAAVYLPLDGQALSLEAPFQLVSQLREHVRVLADAVMMSTPTLFESHVLQARRLAAGQGRDQELHRQLLAIRKTLLFQLPVREYELTNSVLTAALLQLRHTLAAGGAPAATTHLTGLAHDYLECLLAGKRREAIGLVLGAVREGAEVTSLYLQVFQPVLREVGARWHRGEVSVAVEHFCTASTELAMAQLYPYLGQEPRNGHRLVAGSVAGDLHVIGLRMVADFLEAAGWETYYLGGNTPTDSLVGVLRDQQADLLLLGGSMPHHVGVIQQVIDALRRSPVGAQVKVMVGGRPFNEDPELWQHIGADTYAPDAEMAVRHVHQLFAQ